MTPISMQADGPLAILTIEHPPLNLFDEQLFDALEQAIVRAACEGGAHAADAIMPQLAGALFDTEDLKGAVRSSWSTALGMPPSRAPEHG